MGTLKTLVVDDEKPARERLIHLLAKDDRIELLGDVANGVEAIDFIESQPPDLVLLDVQMPGLDGFDVVRLAKNLPLIIFTTAFDEYAIKAFEVHALDYLLKPIPENRLKQAIERALKEKALENSPDALPERRKRTLEAVTSIAPTKALSRIPVRTGEKIRLIDVNEILWFQVREKLVSLITQEGEEDTHFTTIQELEKTLDPEIFFRIHRSVMINLNHIKEIQPWFNGAFKVVMGNAEATELDISREHARRLRKQIGW